MFWRLIIAAFLLIATAIEPGFAATPNYIQQSGNSTNGHVPCFVTSGIVQDCGPGNEGNSTEFGITKSGGLPFCISTAKDPSSNIKFCLSISPSSASIIINSFNGATAPPCQIIINGVSTPCSGGTIGTTALRRITSGSTDTATSNDVSLLWASGTTAAKTESLYPCNSAAKGNLIVAVDQAGTASTYPISLVPNGTDTIFGMASYVININHASVSLQCDGVNSWVIE